ncbi:transglutaminase-like domain-containing protein [Planctomicrobium piriforme]|uniref:Transglutaminase-like enzyme, putative cysteine protease n=1 Tax=Planctomicrobium piriforme TaxID=1576369 RepID=A0A1I3L6T0_9PLAN|nr:transglutaminase family protein [Planctomicrobium piriforme]SFI80135.1 Transglutaminase-like enzyme, putative cysteine protease [Planctomicrobium piriforme]
MSLINVGSILTYEVRQQTVFLFQISSSTTSHQQVSLETLEIAPHVPVENFAVGFDGNRLQRIIVEPCQLQVTYKATVALTPGVDQPEHVEETTTSLMPPDVLTYLNPSRYCESDLLARFAFEEFGGLQPGFSRVQAVCNWVYEHLDYTPGSTTGTTTAADVLLQRTGVCRDYSHLAITLCRGLGIPARYVAGYAVNLFPPDFHGFFEAFLGGHWYLFDPTRLAFVDGLVRIGVGRDAADVSFATLNGNAVLTSKSVWANQVVDPNSPDGMPVNLQAITTA